MSRRAKIRWISYGLALVVCFSAALIACFTGANRYETRINADTGRALGAAVNAVDALDRSLQKSACATTPSMVKTICMDVYSNAQQAETALSVLPVKSTSLEQIARHIAVVGDYASMLSRTGSDEAVLSGKSLQELAQFSDTTAALCDALADLQRHIADGETASETFERITDTLDNLEAEVTSEASTMETQMEAIAKAFPNVPALIYDGKYSDHSSDTPKALENEPECTQEEALAAAAEWLGCVKSELQPIGALETEIPCYCFETDRVRIAITKHGAKTLWMMDEADSEEAEYTQEDAEKAAAAYLEKHGITDMELTKTVLSGGEANSSFAAVLDDNVLCYPDEIKVTVSLSSGEITAYNAHSYLMHHTQRELNELFGGREKTDAAVPAFLTVQSVRPVILNAIGTEERACYQYTCADEAGDPYQICVNAKTGEQEQILLPDEVWIEAGTQ